MEDDVKSEVEEAYKDAKDILLRNTKLKEVEQVSNFQLTASNLAIAILQKRDFNKMNQARVAPMSPYR